MSRCSSAPFWYTSSGMMTRGVPEGDTDAGDNRFSDRSMVFFTLETQSFETGVAVAGVATLGAAEGGEWV